MGSPSLQYIQCRQVPLYMHLQLSNLAVFKYIPRPSITMVYISASLCMASHNIPVPVQVLPVSLL